MSLLYFHDIVILLTIFGDIIINNIALFSLHIWGLQEMGKKNSCNIT